MVGRKIDPFGMAYFQGRSVKLPGSKDFKKIWRFPQLWNTTMWDAEDRKIPSHCNIHLFPMKITVSQNSSLSGTTSPFTKPTKKRWFFLNIGGFCHRGVSWFFASCFVPWRALRAEKAATPNEFQSIKVNIVLTWSCPARKNYLSTGWQGHPCTCIWVTAFHTSLCGWKSLVACTLQQLLQELTRTNNNQQSATSNQPTNQQAQPNTKKDFRPTEHLSLRTCWTLFIAFGWCHLLAWRIRATFSLEGGANNFIQ